MFKYFKPSDFECSCCEENEISRILVDRLDKLRELYGRAIFVSSGYRCPWWNEQVGGVKGSQHTLGTAADIFVAGDYEEFYETVVESELFDGVGYYPDREFVHVDTRNAGRTPNEYMWEG